MGNTWPHGQNQPLDHPDPTKSIKTTPKKSMKGSIMLINPELNE